MRSRTTNLALTISSVEITPSSPDISFDVSSTSVCPWRASLLRNPNPFLSRLAEWPPALDDAEQHDDDGHHQQNMDEPSHRVRRHDAKEPQDEQNDQERR